MSKTLNELHESLTNSIIRSATLVAKEILSIPMTENEQKQLKEEKFIQKYVVSHLEYLKSRPLGKGKSISNFLSDKSNDE